MRLIKMRCQNCDGMLDVDLDNLQVYCPYCGQKLMMDFEQLAQVLAEKEKTKRAFDKEEHITKRAQMAYDHEERKDDKAWNKKIIEMLIIFGLMIAVVFLPNFMFRSSEKKHEETVAYLMQLEIEIDEAIKQGDYDSAFLLTNKLYCDNYSSDDSATWDAKRETYLKLIEEKRKEADMHNPNKIFMPVASDSFEGKNYNDVAEQLKNLGFTNITTQVATEKPGLLNKNNTVEHILIAGKTTFTTEDCFDKDAPIILYYYSK